jgi:hypothetical protein
MRLSLFPFMTVVCVGLVLAQDENDDTGVYTIQLSAQQGKLARRGIGRRNNLPLADYFLGTDLQVSCGYC